MRQWRVGTVSMGVSLMAAGVCLLWTQVAGAGWPETLLTWWPLVFILLGGEILLYAWFSRKAEQTVIRYDIFSIFFVGLIGMVGVLFALLSSVGVIGEVRQAVSAVVRTLDLPDVKQSVPASVRRIVVETGRLPLRIEGTEQREIRLWGSYRMRAAADEEVPPLQPADIASVHTVGDTIYLSVKMVPEKEGPFADPPDVRVTLALPRDVDVEVRGEGPIEVNPGALHSHWNVRGDQDVTVNVPEKSDMLVAAVSRIRPAAGDIAWQPVPENAGQQPAPRGEPGGEAAPEPSPDRQPDAWRGQLKTGSGTYHLDVEGDLAEVHLNHSM